MGRQRKITLERVVEELQRRGMTNKQIELAHKRIMADHVEDGETGYRFHGGEVIVVMQKPLGHTLISDALGYRIADALRKWVPLEVPMRTLNDLVKLPRPEIQRAMMSIDRFAAHDLMDQIDQALEARRL